MGGEFVTDRDNKRIVAAGGIAAGDGEVLAPQVGMANHHSAAVYVVCQHVAHRCSIGKWEIQEGHNDLIRLELSQGRRARLAVEEVNRTDTGPGQEAGLQRNRLDTVIGIHD